MLTSVITVVARRDSVASLDGDDTPFATEMILHESRWADALRYNANEAAKRHEDQRSPSWQLQASVQGDESDLHSRGLLDSSDPVDDAKRHRLLAVDWRSMQYQGGYEEWIGRQVSNGTCATDELPGSARASGEPRWLDANVVSRP